MRRYLAYIICVLALGGIVKRAAAQSPVSLIGTIRDQDTKTPLRMASIHVRGTSDGTLTDSAGNYSIQALPGRWLVFSYLGYYADSVQINSLFPRQRLDIELRKNPYNLAEVEIRGRRIDYSRDSAQRRNLFGDVLDEQKTHGLGAVFSPVSGLYDAFSGRQKRKWRFQKEYAAYEQQKFTESRIRPGQVEILTGLKGDSLDMFMYWYRPSYLFVRRATDYEIFSDIKAAVARFRRLDWKQIKSPAPIRLQSDE
ncbi:carboxypeptidase-like regulatory domain-containing protein [Compostibacter hankyongensis]|uniref:Carboxypeptidase-like regulatory domain-containing protein n=1 Tax=Compostibacter hankyongensis TaxID=1007089 RepID=A0ABP8FHV8_9BACT